MRLVIVGGGIAGLATAWAACRNGSDVVLLDQGKLPNPMAASSDSSRVLRHAYGPTHGYAAMAVEAYAAWDRLWRDLGATHYEETGNLILGTADDPWIAGSLRSFDRLGIPHEGLKGSALLSRFPMVDEAAAQSGHFSPKAGVLFADRIVTGLIAWLRRKGVEIRENAKVEEIDENGASVRCADGRQIEGDAVLVACGAWAGNLAADLMDSIAPSRQVVLYVKPPAALESAWAQGPVVSHVESTTQRILYALPPVAGTHIKFGDHRMEVGGDPDAPRVATHADVAAILHLARGSFADIDGYRLVSSKVCFYTVTPDERFLVRRRGRTVYLSACSGHGFKFGALVGERTAEALTELPRFESYRDWLAGTAEV
jgi:glycine/D-amino acid oxidase-like deaminating enzyme